MADTLRVFEYESICFKKGRKYFHSEFKESHQKAFESYYLENGSCPFFELIPQGVRFKSYVGVIHIGKLTIEVLPKADRHGETDVWHGVLLDMLKTCSLLTAKDVGNAPLRLRSNSILDLYFELFLRELDYLFRRGLMNQYRKKEGQQKALKGALVFSQHLRKNIVHKERFYTRRTSYDKDHLIHQILFEALCLTDRLASKAELGDLIGRLMVDSPTVRRLSVSSKTFERLPENRKTEPYKKALEIAKLLLLNFRPDIRTGKNDMIALMFDMNMLWEEYVLRELQRELIPQGWRVSGQKSQKFWNQKRIRPDIVLQRDEEIYVLDTKWKVPDNAYPSVNDLKQMYVYNHHWKANQSMLLYPKSSEREDTDGLYHLEREGDQHGCKMGFVHVLKGKKLDREMGQKILSKIDLQQ
jgi:5-methylcytosine-specific restriction enzyme subunit McrC